jgi:hypothetical protein
MTTGWGDYRKRVACVIFDGSLRRHRIERVAYRVEEAVCEGAVVNPPAFFVDNGMDAPWRRISNVVVLSTSGNARGWTARDQTAKGRKC